MAVGIIAALFSAGSGAAWACSGLACEEPELGPPHTADVPINVPAFFVRLERLYQVDAAPDGGAPVIRLVDDMGAAVPIAVEATGDLGSFWVRPSTKLAPGRYKLGVAATCERPRGQPTTGSPTAPRWKETTLVATNEHALPNTAGTLQVVSRALEAQYLNGLLSLCEVRPDPAAVVQFTFAPSPQMAPFMPVARATLKVDGKVWAKSRFGTLDVTRTIYEAERSPLQVHMLCGTTRTYPSPDLGLAPGAHVAQLSLEIAGGPTLQTEQVPFNISCDDVAPTDGSASLDAGLSTDAGESDASPSDDIGADGCGCHVARPSRGGSWSWLCIPFALAMAVRRSRLRVREGTRVRGV